MTLCFQGKVEGWTLSNSIPSLYAELSETIGAHEASHKLKEALDFLPALPLNEEAIRLILDQIEPGALIQDSLRLQICEQFGLDYFVTEGADRISAQHNRGFKSVGIVNPATFLSIFREASQKPIKKVPLLDTKAAYHQIYNRIHGAINRVVLSGKFILGKEVKELEEALASYCHCRYAIGLSSGTDALLVALMASKIKPGEIVATTPYSFFATAGVIARLGARPLFVDIDRETYNIDPIKLKEALMKLQPLDLSKVKAIIPVHLFGQCADLEPILSLADQYQLAVIEDAAQAIGARDKTGHLAGSLGTMGCFSFFPSKNLGGFGDSGLLTTNNGELAESVEMLRTHGAKQKYYHRLIGGNFRMDALQAAIIKEKLPFLDEWTRMRQENARFYSTGFKELNLDHVISLPKTPAGVVHIFNQYVIRAPKRDALKAFLSQKGIDTEIYYPIPLHLQECFAYLGYKMGDFPESEQASQETLALPVYPGLTQAMQEYVMKSIKAFYSGQKD
ncbi:MAG: DegT/DnrJ/EryC1/StrS family aminotransferase [Candidatus Tectomicrobia bacterium]|uniref:DegT/DnrJ/EryC1/StrS family aminotransferase n=1 Tax=Tectimicrobiota bacterium TaxID=2528274 RepID=A0A933LP77_UNCTE|nr:DegT/DnrJ/EryC1/StrS family aminotransferase [Candidatus Tectomicrobia bacterium]